MKKVFLLGATGSIGDSTLEVVSDYSDRLKIVGLSAHYNDKKLSELGIKYGTENLALTGKETSQLTNIKSFGMESLLELIKKSDADIVVNGIAGSSGLLPSITSIKSGKDLALANKETLVMAGGLIGELASKHELRILPVDSEHAALFALCERVESSEILELILTASGGAFRELPVEALATVGWRDALAHPTWNMGTKITIDSASMANSRVDSVRSRMSS